MKYLHLARLCFNLEQIRDHVPTDQGGPECKSGLGFALSQSITKLDLVVFYTDSIIDDSRYPAPKAIFIGSPAKVLSSCGLCMKAAIMQQKFCPVAVFIQRPQ